MTTTDAGPQSCYAEEIATLHGMFTSERQTLALMEEWLRQGKRKAAVLGAIMSTKRRIEALTTAIEALGGAL